MKTISLLLLIALGMNSMAIATSEPAVMTKTSTATYVKENHPSVSLPTDFAKPFIIDKSDLKLIGENEIYRIDLIYTKFKSSPDFNQEELNVNRIQQLRNLIPQIEKDNPEWNLVEQTGAKDKNVAKTYFHGFEIYYKPKSKTHQELISIMSSYDKPLKTYNVTAEQGGTYQYPSGTTFHIPANAVKDENGKLVSGEFDIHYTEYRNQADIALSGIPMTYLGKDNLNYNFTSKGMYEIRGSQNGKPLTLVKPITVDFNATNSLENTEFYAMDDKTGDWKLVKPLAPNKDEKIVAKPEVREVDEIVAVEVLQINKWIGKDYELTFENENDSTYIKFDNKGWKNFTKKVILGDINMDTYVQTNKDKTVKVKQTDALTFANQFLPEIKNLWGDQRFNMEFIGQNAGNQVSATLLPGGGDKGHTYPNLVKGLNSPDFGVYNCDQVYRLGKAKTVSPVYTSNGEKIDSPNVTCVLDLSFNGSFSFDPAYVTLNPEGKNAILLFTKDKKVFISLPNKSEKLDFSQQNVIMEMIEITDKMKSSDDLKSLLNI